MRKKKTIIGVNRVSRDLPYWTETCVESLVWFGDLGKMGEMETE